MKPMKQDISIKETIAKKKGIVTIHGWVHRERGSNERKFIQLRDSSGIIQCLIERSDIGDKKFETADKIQVEYALRIEGQVKEDPRSPSGFEIHVKDFEVVGESNEFPIGKDFSEEYLLDVRHLWLRSRKMIAIMKVRSTVFGAIHDYFRQNGYYEHQSPIFMSSQCEGGSTLFEVNYFGNPLYLAQTWQLHAEAMIYALEKIYTIAPSFRAEKSKTSRHLTEYWHAEAELAWADFDDVIGVGEGLIKHVVKTVLEKNQAELETLKRDISKLNPIVDKKFKRITYDEALKILKEKCKMKLEWGKDLRTLEEDALSALYDVPLIITHYPKKVKAFYMMEDSKKPDVVYGCDFIATEGHGEIIGGSQREHDIEKIKIRLKEQGEDLKNYEFYLDTRRYGSVPHGGFGLGVERLIKWICGLDNIKDAIAFPRTMFRYVP